MVVIRVVGVVDEGVPGHALSTCSLSPDFFFFLVYSGEQVFVICATKLRPAKKKKERKERKKERKKKENKRVNKKRLRVSGRCLVCVVVGLWGFFFITVLKTLGLQQRESTLHAAHHAGPVKRDITK